MSLVPFQKNKKKKQTMIVFSIGVVLLIAGIILYRTYSLFEEIEDYDVIKGSVPNYLENYDIKINFKVDGVSVNQAPERNDKKGVESITCDKGAMGSWDYINWNFNVNSLSQTKTTCTVNFVTRYTEDILNGTDPVLKDELIPVTIDNDGIVHKANIKEKWYEYSNQQWANAVILEDESINYQNGEIVPESNIESYFVWIPRYKYKLFNQNNGNYTELTSIENKPQVIDVVFGIETTTDSDSSCKTPMESGESGKCSVGKYITHPSFISFQSTGMWVGKFETGYKDALTKEEAQQNVNDASKIQIKPNVYSWRGIQAANAYWTSYNYKRDYNSHIMKNTEWGAVAYLQHSKYGSQASVRINNNASYMTGYAAKKEPTCGYTGANEECNRYETINTLGSDGTYTVNYFNSANNLASTTRNYSGIYDMSGGSWEYVMGVMLNSTNTTPCSGRNATYNSGFNGPYCNTSGSLNDGVSDFPSDTRYYDTYAYATDDENYNRRILGDATGEMGPFAKRTYGSRTRQVGSWHDDEAWFVWHVDPWFYRGGHWNRASDAGVFDFSLGTAYEISSDCFRIVLSV